MLRTFRYLCLASSPLIKTEGYRQHIFRWGVGNKFRSVNANRFTPVHHARPKEVTIRDDYFESPDREAIEYDEVNEQWEVYWRENNKMNAKPFPIKKFGIDQSKIEATKFLQHLKDTNRYSSSESLGEPKSRVEGVCWDDRLQSWMVMSSKPTRFFSASKHGVSGAQKLAEEFALKSRGRIEEDRFNNAVKAFTASLRASSHQ